MDTPFVGTLFVLAEQISPTLYAKIGVKKRKFHANFTLLGAIRNSRFCAAKPRGNQVTTLKTNERGKGPPKGQIFDSSIKLSRVYRESLTRRVAFCSHFQPCPHWQPVEAAERASRSSCSWQRRGKCLKSI